MTPEVVEEGRRPRLSPQLKMTSFSGPLPSPAVLAGYERVLEGAAERILRLAEKNQAHRHAIERKAIAIDKQSADLDDRFGVAAEKSEERGQRLEERAQIFAFVIVMAAMIAATVLIAHGYVFVGPILFGGTLVSVVGAFLKIRQWEEKDDDEEEDGSEESGA